MRVNVRGQVLPAFNIAGTGYADAGHVLTALGIPIRFDKHERLQVGLRRLAEVTGEPHHWSELDQTFYIGTVPAPVPPLPREPVGASTDPWLPVNAPITSSPIDRKPALLERVIRQFQVAVNPRHAPRGGVTWCNIFLWDVTRALGADIPHWVDHAGTPTAVGRGRELDANATVQWLRRHGPEHGWKPTTADGALLAANMGRPAVAAWLNPGRIGHVAVVRPGAANPVRGVPIAQAGAVNFDDGYLVDGFGALAAAQVEYFVHA